MVVRLIELEGARWGMCRFGCFESLERNRPSLGCDETLVHWESRSGGGVYMTLLGNGIVVFFFYSGLVGSETFFSWNNVDCSIMNRVEFERTGIVFYFDRYEIDIQLCRNGTGKNSDPSLIDCLPLLNARVGGKKSGFFSILCVGREKTANLC